MGSDTHSSEHKHTYAEGDERAREDQRASELERQRERGCATNKR